jgi:hypothetical protein
MENADFKLKNTHRVRALKLAISLINEQAAKPHYERRLILAKRIAQISHVILSDASIPFSGIRILADAGVCNLVERLSLGHFANPILGLASLNPEFGDNWHVITDHSRRPVVTLSHPSSDVLPLPGKIASFESTNWRPSGHLVPVANLNWVLTHAKATGGNTEIAGLVAEVLDVVSDAIIQSFGGIREIVNVIAACSTYSELVAAFPAAEELFRTSKPAPKVDHSPSALQLLHSIS